MLHAIHGRAPVGAPTPVGAPVPAETRRAPRAADRSLLWRHRRAVAPLFGALVLAGPALAQASGGDAGTALWGAFRSVLYGPWGLVGSAVIVALGIYMFLERGFLHALAVMAAGGLIFFVPLIVVSMRNAAQAMGGAG